MTTRTRTALGTMLVLTAGLLAWLFLREPAGRPDVSVTFLGYTNDAVGTRLASFAISNASRADVLRITAYQLQIPAPKRWTNIFAGRMAGDKVLGSGNRETLTIAVPTNVQVWRAWFNLSTDVGVVPEVMQFLSHAAQRVGIPPMYRIRLHGVYSDWISE